MFIIYNLIKLSFAYCLLVIFNPKKEWDQATKDSKAKLFKVLAVMILVGLIVLETVFLLQLIDLVKEAIEMIKDIMDGTYEPSF